jgi:TolB protein
MRLPLPSLVSLFLGLGFCAAVSAADLGLFTDHTDIGPVKRAGTVAYDAARGVYTVGGSGTNMWFARDEFHFVWTKVSGDVALAATVAFVGDGTEPHRKAVLMIRQTLDLDSPYVDAAVHADGLTSLQFRETAGGNTSEVQTTVTHPRRLRLEKRGDTVYMLLGDESGGAVQPTGCSVRVPFTDEYYLGIGVCAHNPDEFETVAFSQVEIAQPAREAAAVRSIIETIPIPGGDRRALYHTNDLIEAPNWALDGSLIFNGGGRIYRLPLGTLPDGKLIPAGAGRPQVIDTGFATRCNNDHGLTPDNTRLIISDHSQDGKSRIYTLPITGGTPVQVTRHGPSYWHGVSPEGKTLAYCAERDGKYGIFTIPITGGEETRLTITDGLDDGPDYSPDGRWIYFNSDRTGRMQIWRMHPDGTQQEQVTDDGFNNWFPHPSPDGKWIVFLTYAPDVKGHPRDHDVQLRLMPVGGGETTTLVELFGGQGTINVPSWSPDSSRIAYVRYQPAVQQ